MTSEDQTVLINTITNLKEELRREMKEFFSAVENRIASMQRRIEALEARNILKVAPQEFFQDEPGLK